MSNCHRPLSMWFGENYKSEEEDSEEDSLDPGTMKLDRPLSFQQAQNMFNYFLINNDLLASKAALIKLERTVSMAHMQVRDSQTLFSSLNEIMSHIVRNIEKFSRDSDLVPPLLELFKQIQYRANEGVELRGSQKIEVQNTLSIGVIEVRGKQIGNQNPFRDLCNKYKLADKIEILESINHRVYMEGILKRKTEKNRKVRQKKREKERKERERDEVIETVNELPCKRSKCEEMEMDMQEVCKKVKDYEEFPKGWLVNVGFLDDEEREDGEGIYDKCGDLGLQDQIRIFESDTELPEEGTVFHQDQDGFNLYEEHKEVISPLDPDKQTSKSADDEVVYIPSLDHPEESKLPQYLEESNLYEEHKEVISPLDPDKQTAPLADDEVVYKSSLDYQEESKLPQYLEESKQPINHSVSEPIIKLHKTVSPEESDLAEELSNQSPSESELPDSHDEGHIIGWYIVSNEELSSYQGRDNDMIIPESRCLSRFPF